MTTMNGIGDDRLDLHNNGGYRKGDLIEYCEPLGYWRPGIVESVSTGPDANGSITIRMDGFPGGILYLKPQGIDGECIRHS